jgi:hypothetical protein
MAPLRLATGLVGAVAFANLTLADARAAEIPAKYRGVYSQYSRCEELPPELEGDMADNLQWVVVTKQGIQGEALSCDVTAVRRNVRRNADELTFACGNLGQISTGKEIWSLEFDTKEIADFKISQPYLSIQTPPSGLRRFNKCALQAVPVEEPAIPMGGGGKEIKGAPKALIGYFGTPVTDCRSYHRRHDLRIFGKDSSYSWCRHETCVRKVASHRVTPTGFILTFAFKPGAFNRPKKDYIAKTADKDVYLSGYPNGETLSRCSRKDAIAGIGMDAQKWDGDDADYSAHYALALPKFCPSVVVDTDLANHGPPAR